MLCVDTAVRWLHGSSLFVFADFSLSGQCFAPRLSAVSSLLLSPREECEKSVSYEAELEFWYT